MSYFERQLAPEMRAWVETLPKPYRVRAAHALVIARVGDMDSLRRAASGDPSEFDSIKNCGKKTIAVIRAALGIVPVAKRECVCAMNEAQLDVVRSAITVALRQLRDAEKAIFIAKAALRNP